MAEMKSVQLMVSLVSLLLPHTLGWLLCFGLMLSQERHSSFLAYFLSRWGDGTGNYNEDNFWEPAYDEDYIEVL